MIFVLKKKKKFIQNNKNNGNVVRNKPGGWQTRRKVVRLLQELQEAPRKLGLLSDRTIPVLLCAIPAPHRHHLQHHLIRHNDPEKNAQVLLHAVLGNTGHRGPLRAVPMESEHHIQVQL